VEARLARGLVHLYYLGRACQTQVLAMSTGRPLKRISDNLAATAFAEWEGRDGSYARAHFAALKRLLDRDDADASAGSKS